MFSLMIHNITSTCTVSAIYTVNINCLLLCSLSTGAALQNSTGDPEVGAHVRGVQFKAEAEQHGEGQV